MDSRTTVRRQPLHSTPIFREQAVTSTAAALSAIDAEALNSGKLNELWLTADADLRYRFDGSSPTTVSGHVLVAGTPLYLTGRKRILDLRFVGDGGASALVSWTLDNTADAGGIQ